MVNGMSHIRIHQFHPFSVHRWYHWVILFVLLLLMLLIFPRAAGSQEWDVFTTDNAPLVNDRINAIAFDSSGRAWIGTNGGLMRYDDGEWETWTSATSDLPSDIVTDVAVDNDNRVWVTTSDASAGGVAVISGGDWTVYTPANTEDGLKDNMVNAVVIDDVGTAWIGTQRSAVCTWDGTLWDWLHFDRVPELNSYYIHDLHLASNGVVWIATKNGIATYNGAVWEHHDIPVPVYGPQGIEVKHITSNQHGYIYAVTSYGVWNYSGGWCEEPIDVNYEPLTGIMVTLFNTTHDAVGSVFGLAVREVGDWELYTAENSQLPNNAVTVLATGPDGRLWVGTTAGIAVISGMGIAVEDTPSDGPQALVTAGPVYPNPFNSAAVIPFELSETGPVTVELYTVTGQHVRALASGVFATGHHTVVWDGTDATGGSAPAGVYLFRIATPRQTAPGRMVLMK